MLPKLIAVSGLPGVGKSTLTRAFAPALGYEFLIEDVSNNPYLRSFSVDPKRHAFTLQMWFLQYRYHEQERICRRMRRGGVRGCLFDRTLWDGLAFVRALTRVGRLDPSEARTYHQVFDIAARNLAPPALVLFLQCRADTARARILKRGAPKESQGLTLEYLDVLRQEYLRLLRQWEAQGIRVIRFNAEEFVDLGHVTRRLARFYSFPK